MQNETATPPPININTFVRRIEFILSNEPEKSIMEWLTFLKSLKAEETQPS